MPRTIVDLDRELMEWLDAEGEKRERSRSWLVNRICRMYRDRLERDRERRAARRERSGMV